MRYAVGKKSLAICDRCGQQYPYLTLRKEWTGFKVCQECFEVKHPQLEPDPPPFEPQALYEPRPARVEPQTVVVGQTVFPPPANLSTQAVASVGSVEVSTP
jgi:hypothetical protein